MGALLEVILPVFLVIGAGWIVAKRGLMEETHFDALMIFTQGFAIPCLLFRAIATLDLGTYFDAALLGAYYGPAIFGFALGTFGARLIFARPWEDSVAIGFCCLFMNSVLLGLPITERAYGADALDANYALVAINAPVCYGIGITAMEIVRNKGGSLLATAKAVLSAILHNNLMIGIALGFAVNLTSLPLPTVLWDAIDMMIRGALPVAVFGLGGILARYKIEGDLPPVLMICGLSLLVQPALTFALTKLFALDIAPTRSAVLTAAMAPGVNAYVFANMYGVAKRVAASAVLITTALSIITIWAWLLLLP